MDRQESLLEKLQRYASEDHYPFHMPGHKRRLAPAGLEQAMGIDITEIDGFDNLHDAEGILKEAQEEAARLYNSVETSFMVNGSTGGILAAVAGVCSFGGEIAAARNCHQSVFHAMAINHLKPVYIYPQINGECGINEGVYPQDVEKLWITNPNIQAIVITSPTYAGVVSDIREICRIAHTNHTPVIVDEAHGAHMTFHEYFPESAVDCGADVVIQSTHKTLPMMTQTALLHINGDLVDADRIRRMLSVYQTSSPSYVLMASIDAGLRMIAEKRETLFDAYVNRLKDLRRELGGLKHLRLFEPEMLDSRSFYDYDRSKLLIMTGGSNLTGADLQRLLRQKYHLETEMALPEAVLAMTSVGDDYDGFRRLLNALTEIDGNAGICEKKEVFPPVPEAKCAVNVWEADRRKHRLVSLNKAAGMISAEDIYLYPPDIPLVTPGEVLTDEVIGVIRHWLDHGLTVKGLTGSPETGIMVKVIEN